MDVNVQFFRPTTRADGSALPVSDIATYLIFSRLNGGAYTDTGLTAPGDAQSVLIPTATLTPGVHNFAAKTVDVSGQQSDLSGGSNAVTIAAPVAPPNPPTNVSATLQ